MKATVLFVITVQLVVGLARDSVARSHHTHPARFPSEFRTIDAYGNNPRYPWLGTPHVPLRRLTPSAYADRKQAPSGATRPNPRAISNAVHAQGSRRIPNESSLSDLFWMWGQFLDHDISLTEPHEPHEPFNIPVPPGDPFFDPQGSGGKYLPLDRSLYDNDRHGVRQQLNEITAFIDGSMVYGSGSLRARVLRTLDGTGRLETSAGNLLPLNTLGLPNAGGPDSSLFVAGDVRVNENVSLTVMHTLFVREHNYWCDLLACAGKRLRGDQIYEIARAIVIAEIQSITYNEFLPLLLGNTALDHYEGYRVKEIPEVGNEFSTASFRLGHSMLNPCLLRLRPCGKPFPGGCLPLREGFFKPELIKRDGIEPYLRGALRQLAQNIDVFIVDDVRNFLFGDPGEGGSDLISLNIQRGRDHGLANYNRIRKEIGLEPVRRLGDISSDPEVRARLASIFPSANEMDLFTGELAEDPVCGAQVGPTIRTILIDQYTRLRDGDRFWYQSYLPSLLVWMVERRTLADIIRRNTPLRFWEVQEKAFVVESSQCGRKRHDSIEESVAERLAELECRTVAQELVDFYTERCD